MDDLNVKSDIETLKSNFAINIDLFSTFAIYMS